MNNVEFLLNFITALFGAGGAGLILLRMVDKRLEAQSKNQAMQLQIALKDKEADIATAQTVQNNVGAMVSLLQTQLQQIPQLTTHIRELVDRIDSNQRQSSANIETILQAYRRDVDSIIVGFRTMTDTHILQSTMLTNTTSKVESSVAEMRGMVASVQSGFDQMRVDDTRNQTNLDEVIETVVEMRNTVMRLTGHGESAMIRPADDSQSIRLTPRSPAASDQVVTQKIPDLQRAGSIPAVADPLDNNKLNKPALAAGNADTPINTNPTTEPNSTSTGTAPVEGTNP